MFKINGQLAIAVFGTGFLLFGCQTTSWQDQKNTKFNKAHNEFYQKIDEHKSILATSKTTVGDSLSEVGQASPVNCKHEAWEKMSLSVLTIEELANYRWILWKDEGYTYYYSVDSVRRINLGLFDDFTKEAINARFDIADTALKGDCLDIADENYRHVIKVYTGSSYAAQRDRAKLGIDDVRQKRGG